VTNYFNPNVAMRNVETGRAGALCIVDGHLAVWNRTDGAYSIAPGWVVMERTPVTSWLTGILLDAWLQFAHRDDSGCLNSGGLDVLDDIKDVLISAGFLDSDGQPKREMTLPLGAGGMEERK